MACAQKFQQLYFSLPPWVLIGLVSFCIFWLNMCAHNNSMSTLFSPCTIVCGVKLDFKKYYRAEFDAYAQVYQDAVPCNSTDLPCATNTLVHGFNGAIQGFLQIK